MDAMLMLIGTILALAGVAGSVLPILPGPPLCLAGLLLQQLRSPAPYGTGMLATWTMVVVVVTALDYWVTVEGPRLTGGTRYGMWGCTVGLLASFWMGPAGIVIGPMAGAFIGEMLAGGDARTALRASIGSFLGFLAGTLLKLVASLAITWRLLADIASELMG